MNSNRTLFDVSWEVCNMVGGIHTVLVTKLAETRKQYNDDYVAIGPDISRMVDAPAVFREEHWQPRLLEALAASKVHVRMGRWLVPGEPRCLLVNYSDLYAEKDQILARYWEQYKLDSLYGGWDYFDPVLFAHAAGMVIEQYYLTLLLHERRDAVVHCHEWMAAGALLYLKEHVPEIGSVFTTHATTLGRALAANRPDPAFYKKLPTIQPDTVARELGVVAKHSMEVVAARSADVFTTVSAITARECEALLGRAPDAILPNAVGDEFPEPSKASDEGRARARQQLFELAERVTGDTYDRQSTALLLSSGRYEYTNKGLDVYVHALDKLRREHVAGRRVIAFAACPAGHQGPRRDVVVAAKGGARVPEPQTCTHDLSDRAHDPIQRDLRAAGFHNVPGAAVHFIQIPIYLDGTDPLIPATYYDLLAGFDLTVFPSFYEPWGYTPLESVGYGVPTITTDLAGFGQWARERGDFTATGVDLVVREDRAFPEVVGAVAERVREFLKRSPSEIHALRAAARATADKAHWREFARFYVDAHLRAATHAAEREREMPTGRFTELAQHQVLITTTPTGDVTAHMRPFTVTNELPAELEPLRELAGNLWWHWNGDARALFAQIDPELWAALERSGPRVFLERAAPARLRELGASAAYRAELDRVLRRFRTYVAAAKVPTVAYFCMEFGLASHLKVYSGGLGVLAGDHLKTASDMNLPLCAVGLAYKKGYFRQRIGHDGLQEEAEDLNDFAALGAELVTGEQGHPVLITVPFPGRHVHARAWRVRVGRVQLFLLDTDVEANRAEDRAITDALYGGDHAHRAQQEMLLGIGGYALLRRLGIDALAYHMNEGHSSFLLLARLRHFIQLRGLKYEEALEYVRHTSIFTTHTPVPAGHDRFDEALVRPYLAPFEEALRQSWATIFALGSGPDPHGSEQKFSTTNLAIRGSLRINGVSDIHGRVTREMFRDAFPSFHHAEIPIGSVTNGVHAATWVSPAWQRAFDQVVGEDWREHVADRDRWAKIRGMDDAAAWGVHQSARRELVAWLRRHVVETWPRRREWPSHISKALDVLDRDPMIIAFARRFAPYKRADLVFADLERLGRLLRNADRPAVLVFGGKAHPRDGHGKAILQRIVEFARDAHVAGYVFVVEGYDLDVARRLVSGADVWMNTPTRPLEASGTSGMKAAMNGCLNLSVADGWWAEAYNGANGWVVGAATPEGPIDRQNEEDSVALYSLLEQEVLPRFARREQGVPRDWVAMIKESIATCVPEFSTHRMLAEYWRDYYEPAVRDGHSLRESEFRGLYELRERKRRIARGWKDISFGDVRMEGLDAESIPVGRPIPVRAEVRHPGLDPELVEAQVVLARGPMTTGHLDHFETFTMVPVERDDLGGRSVWQTEFRCDSPGPHVIGLRVVPRGDRAQGDVDFGLDLVRWF